jgi:hypothetical protein
LSLEVLQVFAVGIDTLGERNLAKPWLNKEDSNSELKIQNGLRRASWKAESSYPITGPPGVVRLPLALPHTTLFRHRSDAAT